MDIVQVTFLLAIATFALAVVATLSAGFTAWMACETKKSRKLYEEVVEQLPQPQIAT